MGDHVTTYLRSVQESLAQGNIQVSVCSFSSQILKKIHLVSFKPSTVTMTTYDYIKLGINVNHFACTPEHNTNTLLAASSEFTCLVILYTNARSCYFDDLYRFFVGTYQ